MSVHDWTRVDAGIFHDFHNVWLGELRTLFNEGLLPGDYYALAEQHAGEYVADVLTLHASDPAEELPPIPPSEGGLLLAEAPPNVRRKLTADEAYRRRQRTLAIRHVSGHRLVALIEIVSPGNKDRREHVEQFVAKAAEALEYGVHVMVVDVFPPGRHDPRGMPGAVWDRCDGQPYELPSDEPLSAVSYLAGPPVEAYIEHMAVGGALPEMPLFLRSERYIPAPLEAAYQAAYRGVPAFWKAVLEGRGGANA
jgi:hypothetical protein